MLNTDFNLYAFFIFFSLFMYFINAYMLSKKYKIQLLNFINSLLFVFTFIIIGAISLTFFENIIKNRSIVLGLSSAGGAIGAILGILFYCTIYKKNIKNFLTVYILPLPLAYGLAKIGCFLVGCCYGIYYNGFGHIIYNYSLSVPNSVSVFPVQLLEVILNIIVYVFLIVEFHKNKKDILLIADCFILTGLSKFLTDFLRFSHINIILSLNQYICLFFMFIGFTIYIYYKKRQ